MTYFYKSENHDAIYKTTSSVDKTYMTYLLTLGVGTVKIMVVENHTYMPGLG